MPVELFVQKFPNTFREVGNGLWFPIYLQDELSALLGSLRAYYSQDDEGTTELFLTTNNSYLASEYHEARNIDVNRVMSGAAQFQNWVNQAFPQVASKFGLTLFTYSEHD